MLVNFRPQRSSFFVEFAISLALAQVFDDFLFEVLHVFRVDISTTDQFLTSNGSPFVEFHISISSDRRNPIKSKLIIFK